jgi:hypothetical protein
MGFAVAKAKLWGKPFFENLGRQQRRGRQFAGDLLHY